jgi:hypothetical protein
MQVRALSTQGKELSERSLQLELVTADFSLKVGGVFNVYGIVLRRGSLDYFIHGWNTGPGWFPAELFEVIDYRLPPNWLYKFSGYCDSPQKYYGPDEARWGYEELVMDEDHSLFLVVRDDPKSAEAFKVYYQRKAEIDSYFEDNPLVWPK